jgi:pimeloyl-ACP methyl ester carboxylesterase
MEVANNFEYLISDHPKPAAKNKKENPLFLRFIQFGFKTFGFLAPGWAAAYAFKLFTTPRMNATHKVSDPILESARIFEFMYGKFILKGYEWGSGEKTVLLVHGWRSRGTALRSFVPGLLEKGYKVVTFDAPAHGNSPGKSTTLPQFSGAIKAIINNLGGVHGIITHSFGGASTVFALYSETPNLFINKLVLIAVPSSMENMADSFIHLIKAPISVASGFYKILENRLGISLADAQVSNFFPNLKIGKTLLVHDKKDEVVPFSETESIIEKWDNASLLATDGYGHFQIMKNPDVVEKVVGFF